MILDPTAPHFYREQCWPTDTTFCGDNALTRINNATPLERDVTRVLAFFTGTFGDELARIMLRLAGVTVAPADVELWVGSEWLSATDSKTATHGRSPDIIITRQGRKTNVLLVVEVKGRAWVNGGFDYCPHHCATLGYSNQIICYPGNCWTTVDLSAAPRLLIGPDAHREAYGGWGYKGLTAEKGTRSDLAAAFAAQQAATLRQWHFAGLRELLNQIEQLPHSPGRTDALDVLSEWLERIDA